MCQNPFNLGIPSLLSIWMLCGEVRTQNLLITSGYFEALLFIPRKYLKSQIYEHDYPQLL